MHVAFQQRHTGKNLPPRAAFAPAQRALRCPLVVGQVDLDGIDLQFATG